MTPDSSVIVPALAQWHEHHERCREAVDPLADLVAHAELEAYAVLTRLARPSRIEPAKVALALAESFPGDRLQLDARSRRRLLERFAGLGIRGGQAYDALIAATAGANGHVLLTRDRRAGTTYAALGTEFRLL